MHRKTIQNNGRALCNLCSNKAGPREDEAVAFCVVELLKENHFLEALKAILTEEKHFIHAAVQNGIGLLGWLQPEGIYGLHVEKLIYAIEN